MSTPTSLPRVIYVIRHGEKPGAGVQGVTATGAHSVDALIPRGWQRAGALTSLFAPLSGGLRPGIETPDTLFSPHYADQGGHRAYQTILPLSQRIGIGIRAAAPVGAEARAVQQILATGGDVVLVCWEHQHIPDIANALPLAPGTVVPGPWPGNRFDVIWRFDLDTTGPSPVYRFSQVPQLLLAGDRAAVITPGRRGPARPGIAA